MNQPVDQKLIDFLAYKALQIRIDSLRATTQAGSGHPTSCLSAADLVAVLYFHVLRYDFQDPSNATNDRFILSKGHAVPVVYAALHQRGVITDEELLSFRRIDSNLEGHPTPRFAYNEAATGSLGQGLSIGLGMAMNARHDKLGYRTYVMLGDGELAEGSVWEAAELASHYAMNNLIGILDANRLAQSGPSIDEHHIDRYAQKFQAFGWHTFVIDGHDIAAIVQAFDDAKTIADKPTMIIAKTFKGHGLDGIEDKPAFHGKAFKQDELADLIEGLNKRFSTAAAYKSEYAFHQPLVQMAMQEKRPLCQFDRTLLTNDPAIKQFDLGATLAPRKAFGHALAALGKVNQDIFVLDADVKNSTYTEIFQKQNPDSFVECFIAEQNMVGVATGLALRGKIPFAATFGAFFTRAHDQIRMAAIGDVPLRLCGTHCGVSIGEDGPSQMALEDIAMMRAIPNSVVLYPSDAVSAYKLTQCMAEYTGGISYLRATRADLPVLYPHDAFFYIGGSRLVKISKNYVDRACIVTAGITLHEALKAYDILLQEHDIEVAILDLYSIKPLEVESLVEMARFSNDLLITVEDHYLEGGLGDAVQSALSGYNFIRLEHMAVTKIPRSGSPESLLSWAGIDAKAIVQKVLSVIY